MHATGNIITHFVGLITLKNKPESLAYSINTFVVLFLLLLFCIKITFHNSIPQLAKITTIIPIFITVYEILCLSILYFMLVKSGKKNRFIQTACNFLGVSIINCLLSPIIHFVPFQLFFLCLTKSWLLVINFYITKHAFNISQFRAALTYLFINTIAFFTTLSPFVILSALHHK